MSLLVLSFIAGFLTVLSPCIFTLLPIVIGGSLKEERRSRPFVIIGSLAVSIFVFTFLLKVTTTFINIPPTVWSTVAGVIIVGFGLITLFPKTWDAISFRLGLASKSQEIFNNSSKRKGLLGSILIGASLGPVFSSCSPTYAIIIATILPVDLLQGTIYLLIYIAGLVTFMLLIAIFGQKLVQRTKFAANPNGIFKKVLGVLFIVVGISILTGFDKKINLALAENGFFDATKIETTLLGENSTKMFNVENPYNAPELAGISAWFNSDPLTMERLKGKVVIVDFWTYSCINCIRTTPYLNEWYSKYKTLGFEIIGVHTPEFQFEKNPENVETAVNDQQIMYPVAMDNDFTTWDAYKNRFWPAKYFIDATGKVRHTHFGEGEYKESEEVIKQLLRENGKTIFHTESLQETVSISNIQTPETYLGWSRVENFSNKSEIKYNTVGTYQIDSELESNQWSLGGDWIIKPDNLISESEGSILRIKYSAKDVYLVMGAQAESSVEVTLNDQPVTSQDAGADLTQGVVKVKEYKLYKIIGSEIFKSDQLLELKFPKGMEVNVFTFGSK
jgi:cytochrome c biogenesis protein CcdA/peroxiredoxin